MSTASSTRKTAFSSSKSLVMAQAKAILKKHFGDDSAGLEFALEMLNSSIDLVADAVESGGTLNKAKAAQFLAKRANAGRTEPGTRTTSG